MPRDSNKNIVGQCPETYTNPSTGAHVRCVRLFGTCQGGKHEDARGYWPPPSVVNPGGQGNGQGNNP